MMPIKIECECGQHYAFDVEPIMRGKMPSPVACPTCGADGMAAANETLARQLSPLATAVEPPAPAPVRLVVAATPAQPAGTAPPPPTRRPDPRLGLVDRTQAEHEARAKAMWGDSREQVISYLMIQGFSHQEASDVAQKLFQERVAAVRSNGIRKIIIGIGLICVPIIALIIFLAVRVIPLKLFAVTIMVGLYGLWLVINGILMVAAPKSERGDVADQ
jgi:hypothetical protein